MPDGAPVPRLGLRVRRRRIPPVCCPGPGVHICDFRPHSPMGRWRRRGLEHSPADDDDDAWVHHRLPVRRVEARPDVLARSSGEAADVDDAHVAQ